MSHWSTHSFMGTGWIRVIWPETQDFRAWGRVAFFGTESRELRSLPREGGCVGRVLMTFSSPSPLLMSPAFHLSLDTFHHFRVAS